MTGDGWKENGMKSFRIQVQISCHPMALIESWWAGGTHRHRSGQIESDARAAFVRQFGQPIGLRDRPGSGRVLTAEKLFVEAAHHLLRGFIIDGPEGEQAVAGTRLGKGTAQAHDTLTTLQPT